MITLTVTPDHGDEYTVTATSRDILTWEKTTKGDKTFIDLINSPSLVDLYRVAHLASWRQGLTTAKNLQEFEATCEVTAGLEDDEDQEDEVPDPTHPAASADDSSPSLSEPASAPARGRKKANARS